MFRNTSPNASDLLLVIGQSVVSSCGEFLLNGVFCPYHLFQPQPGIYKLWGQVKTDMLELHQPNIKSNKDGFEKVECLGGLKELIYSEIEKWNLKFEIEYPIDIEIMTVI